MESNGDSGGVSNHNARAENCNPNVAIPGQKASSSSPSIRKSATKSQKLTSKIHGSNSTPVTSPPIQKSASKIPNISPSSMVSPPTLKSGSRNPSLNNPTPAASPSPHRKIRQRKFVMAKRNSKREIAEPCATAPVACKCNRGGSDGNKCLCVAYESLRTSQDEFFRNRRAITGEESKLDELNSVDVCMGREKGAEPSSGRVLDLVKAFEKLLSPEKSKFADEKEEKTVVEDSKDGTRRELPITETQFSPPDLLLTCESLGLESPLGSISRRSSTGDRRSRRKSVESAGSLGSRHGKRRQHKTTSHGPFKLRTEQRGKCKEESFFKKVKEMMEEEEKRRIPTAKGLPWTTDEPEYLVRPTVKENTKAIDLVLHSDIRAVERAEFDHLVAEKLKFIEQYKAQKERQQKLAEEEEIRRLRMELVPKAQPLPYFDRPFVPQRSEKLPTMPKEPRIHTPHHHKKIKS